MIFVTGDTHGTVDYGKIMSISAKYPSLTRDDHVIIAGDFGAVWRETTLSLDLKPFTKLKYTVLFVDGNHENFDLLDSFEVKEWHGGKVHIVAPNIIHLMRGQIYEIEGKTFFTFGGATSVDKIWRREGISWWRQEVPSYLEMEEGIANLKKAGNKVDYIITHSCDESALSLGPLATRDFQTDLYPENEMLSYFEENVEYKRWYFGHYHLDADLNDKKTVLYNTYRIIE